MEPPIFPWEPHDKNGFIRHFQVSPSSTARDSWMPFFQKGRRLLGSNCLATHETIEKQHPKILYARIAMNYVSMF
jgi:hypothetical protein